MLTKIFYRLFKAFPKLEEASREASNRIYDEWLDANPPDGDLNNQMLVVTHRDGEPECLQ